MHVFTDGSPPDDTVQILWCVGNLASIPAYERVWGAWHGGACIWDGRPRNRVTDPPKFQFLRKEKYTDQSRSSQRPVSRSSAVLICGDSLCKKKIQASRAVAKPGKILSHCLIIRPCFPFFPGVPLELWGFLLLSAGDTSETLNRCVL